MTISHYMAQADLEVIPVRESPFVGMTDPRIATLRCFRFYSRDSGTFITDPEGRDRWLGPKASRVYAILHRMATSGDRSTMLAIASEAMCSPSTVSRAVQRLQAFGFFAVDVVRGRHGGITVRLRSTGDAMRHYAEAAWKRIRGAIDRARINVASRLSMRQEGYVQPENEHELRLLTGVVVEDATFSEAWDAVELRLRAEVDRDPPVAPLPRASGGFNPGTLTAENVIAERRWLDEHDPDWDLVAEQARDRWLS